MRSGRGGRIAALFSSDIFGTARFVFSRRLNTISNATQRKQT
jgi:hypothetical protein